MPAPIVKPRKTWNQTVGEMVGYAAALWPGILFAAVFLKPTNPMVIPISGLVSAALVVLVVRYWLMRVPRLRVQLSWLFPAQWITGTTLPPPSRASRRRRR